MTNYEYKYSQKQQKEGWNKHFEELERRWNEHFKQTRIQPTGRNTGSRVWFGDEYRHHFPLKEQQRIPSFQISCWQSNAINPQRKQQRHSEWQFFQSQVSDLHICPCLIITHWSTYAGEDSTTSTQCQQYRTESQYKIVNMKHVSFIYLECIITIEEEGIKQD